MKRAALGLISATVLATATLTACATGNVPASATVTASLANGLTDRSYPVLVDGSGPRGDELTDIGPAWNVTLPLLEAGPIAVAGNGKFAYVLQDSGITVISGVNTAHPRVLPTTLDRDANSANAIVITPSGNYAYVSENVDNPPGTLPVTANVVTVYSGVSTGRLKLTATVPIAADLLPFLFLATSSDGKYVYVAGETSTGMSLTQLTSVSNGHPKVAWTRSLRIAPGSMTLTPNGKFLYFNGAKSLSIVKVGATGVTVVSTFSFRGAPQGMITPNGAYAYESYGDDNVQVLSDAQASPRKDGIIRPPDGARMVTAQPSGQYAYALMSRWPFPADTGTVVALSGTASDHLKAAATWKLSYAPAYIAVSPAG